MRIVIVTAQNHLYANFLLKKILLHFPNDITTIIESSALLPHKTKFQALRKYLQVAGFYYVIVQAIKQIIFVTGTLWIKIYKQKNVFHPFYSYISLAKRKKIPVLYTARINNPKTIIFLKRLKPDIILSIFFNQILAQELLQISTITTLNIHPSLLPSYRGVSPIFWCLVHGEKQTGITVHCVVKKIDAGEIIRQELVEITPDDTEHSLYVRCVQRGSSCLLDILGQVKKHFILQPKIIFGNAPPSYFSLPTKNAVKLFRQKGKKFFRIAELFQPL